jgi:hypothetical protein
VADRLSLRFGVFAPLLRDQLREAGLRVESGALDHFQRDAAAIDRLAVRDVLSDAATTSARKRLLKAITAAAEKRRERRGKDGR